LSDFPRDKTLVAGIDRHHVFVAELFLGLLSAAMGEPSRII